MANFLSSFLHPERGYKKALQEMQNYYNQGQQYLQPYNQNAQSAYGTLSTAMNDFTNPSSFIDRLMSGYQTSDLAKMRQEQARDSGLSALGAMGLAGSTPGVRAIQAGSNQIAAEDEQRFLDRLLNTYLQGANIAQGIYGTGAQAGSALSGNAMNMGQRAGEMAYGRANAPGEMFSNLLGLAGGLGGSYMGMKGMNNLADAWKVAGGR